MGDSDGHRRGAKGIDGYCPSGLTKGRDYGEGPSHNLDPIFDANRTYMGWSEGKDWRLKSVKQGSSPPRYSPTGYHDNNPVEAYSNSGKYGRK